MTFFAKEQEVIAVAAWFAMRLGAATLLTMGLFPCNGAMATEAVLYSFPDAGSGQPTGRLLSHNGSLFGTATGDISHCCGQIFELTQSNGVWTEKTLLALGGAYGTNPWAGLIADSHGALYGTTAYGGTGNSGTVFKLHKLAGSWVAEAIWEFGTASDGQDPFGELLIAPTGAIYGTTGFGGRGCYQSGCGTVFELTHERRAWREKVLHRFRKATGDGVTPVGGLVMDRAGNLYGTTFLGGAVGLGTVFELSPSVAGWKERVIWSFGSGSDGKCPEDTLVQDADGSLYGTTFYGGAGGYGAAFQLVKSGDVWNEFVIHNFSGGNDGANPFGGLRVNRAESLYGTTTAGGLEQQGVLFKLSPSNGTWTETVLHTFGGSDGVKPEGSLILEGGELYGTTAGGGSSGYGTVFSFTK
jgi:uncharacterized repeat protein (TIGR03803 family)